MHNQKRYFKIIEHYQKNLPTQGEWHHIIPKCLGGNNDNTNLVLLPYKAHYICHWLLTRIYPENRKLKHAFAMMVVENPNQQRKFTSKQYDLSRKNRSIALKGIKRTEDVKNKLRKPKSNKENYKKPKSKTHRENISNAHKGRKHHWQYKIFSSNGYIEYQQKRKNEKLERELFHRENFKTLNISRKEYYSLYPDIGQSTLKRYLTNL